ncbi:MAG TPA: hypothetical protein VIK60_17120 [Vicinamibacterales bacterium]
MPWVRLGLVESNAAYLVLAGVGTLDIWLLYRFFSYASTSPRVSQEPHVDVVRAGS